ncbi:hypothetical protein A6R68_19345 [Neotoma lepida]|uniref:Histone H2A n=1 Tax=Neotoma lepida TaxID=56216 RepID=A0A1A6HJ17_NEOLE|nr:hypothetical protein A6R68_19345 [Neotoma lepida]
MPRTRQGSCQGPSSRHFRTSRAQLTFSVSLVEHHLRKNGHAQWLSEMAPILLPAIVEFLICRLLELASNEALGGSSPRSCWTDINASYYLLLLLLQLLLLLLLLLLLAGWLAGWLALVPVALTNISQTVLPSLFQFDGKF